MNGGYQHVEPVLGNFIHGDGKLGDQPINPSGQWDAYLPETHQQDENGFEPFDCVTEATINCIEILELQEYGTNSQWARRFLAKASGTDIRQGNDPQTVAETLRTGGCVYNTDYPFLSVPIALFYQTLSGALKTLAIATFSKFAFGHSWVNGNPTDMKEALTFSPLSAAGYAWTQDANGLYITPQGATPEHDFTVYGHVDGEYWKVRDSYTSFDKHLAWDFQFTGVKRYTLHRQIVNTAQGMSAWVQFWTLIRKILGLP